MSERAPDHSVRRPWWERTSDEDLDYHRRWLEEHGQQPNPRECPLCFALVKRDERVRLERKQ